MITHGWQNRIQDALCKDDVVAVCREYLAGHTPLEIEELPPACRPAELDVPEDVNRYAINLIRHLGIGERATERALNRMSVFFTKAALRLAQVPVAIERRRRPG